MSFRVKVVAERASIALKTDEGKPMYVLKSGSELTISELEMGHCAKSIQALLSIKPPLISVNKVSINKTAQKAEIPKVVKRNRVERNRVKIIKK